MDSHPPCPERFRSPSSPTHVTLHGPGRDKHDSWLQTPGQGLPCRQVGPVQPGPQRHCPWTGSQGAPLKQEQAWLQLWPNVWAGQAAGERGVRGRGAQTPGGATADGPRPLRSSAPLSDLGTTQGGHTQGRSLTLTGSAQGRQGPHALWEQRGPWRPAGQRQEPLMGSQGTPALQSQAWPQSTPKKPAGQAAGGAVTGDRQGHETSLHASHPSYAPPARTLTHLAHRRCPSSQQGRCRPR